VTTAVPGPGQYQIKSRAVGDTAYSMGLKLEKSKEKSPVPGPNVYNPSVNLT
jgi:hypothetical protein